MLNRRKRSLNFHDGNDVVAEIERLRAGAYAKGKNWNLTQICDHLDATMTGEMEGLGFRLPWIMRVTVGKMLTNRILTRRAMPSVPTLAKLKPESNSSEDNPQVIDRCIATIEVAENYSGSLADYPFVDGISHEQWRQLMWIHAAHHLGFLVPSGALEVD